MKHWCPSARDKSGKQLCLLTTTVEMDLSPMHAPDQAEVDPASGASFFLPLQNGRGGATFSRGLFFASFSKVVAADSWKETEAVTFHDLMIIRGCNDRLLQQHPSILGTALGFRIEKKLLTKQPAVLVYVRKKVNNTWIEPSKRLPRHLHGPAGLFCNLDVIEFATGVTESRKDRCVCLKEQLQGGANMVGPGSQVASSELYGTLGVIARCRQLGLLGFVTNRHVAVNLEQPLQRMYHPLPPALGPSMLLGTADRAVSFATDHLWYGMFCSSKPGWTTSFSFCQAAFHLPCVLSSVYCHAPGTLHVLSSIVFGIVSRGIVVAFQYLYLVPLLTDAFSDCVQDVLCMSMGLSFLLHTTLI